MTMTSGPMTATEALRRHREHWAPLVEKINRDMAAIFDWSRIAKIIADAYDWRPSRELTEEDKALHRAIGVPRADDKRWGYAEYQDWAE